MKTKILIVSLILLVSLSISQAPPQFSIANPVLGSTTTYKLSYISSINLNSATTFTVDFSLSFIRIPNGTNNCLIIVNGLTLSSPNCSCLSLVCTFKPNHSSGPNAVMEITIGNVNNPYFAYNQATNVHIYYSLSANYNFSVIILSSNYQPMPMIVNHVKQTDYGVGFTPATYEFNISLSYISKDMQMQVVIPP